MEKIVYNGEYFNTIDTLLCGQIFRFVPYLKGYKVYSKNKCAYVYNENANAVIECESKDISYFHNFFDLDRDYSLIYKRAVDFNYDILTKSASVGRGIRILNQDKTEALFSFMISQNNNIPRIKGIIEKLCTGLGEKGTFNGEEYYGFPSVEKMASAPLEFYTNAGLGYRAPYIKRLAESIKEGFSVDNLDRLSTEELVKSLLSIYGVGEKVANCVTLFGFHRSDSFPVDTWIDKIYREDFNGTLKDRKKITEFFLSAFKEDSGYFQQYLFHYKRNVESKK